LYTSANKSNFFEINIGDKELTIFLKLTAETGIITKLTSRAYVINT